MAAVMGVKPAFFLSNQTYLILWKILEMLTSGFKQTLQLLRIFLDT
jgi:hypothetical protein